MKKVFAAVLIASVALVTQVKADGGAYYDDVPNYRERGSGAGAAIAAGVLGIIAGAINRPRYYYPPPAYYGPYEYGPYEINPYNNPYPYGYRRGYPGYPGPYLGPYPRYGGYGYGPGPYYGRRGHRHR